MPLEVTTNDATSLTDADLDEMGSIEGAFDIGVISKAREDWVLATTARVDDKLHGFMLSTLERIGGTPCVLIGMLSVRRNSKRDTVLRGLMGEAYHRALMAFPDEDVVVGSRFVSADGMEAFDKLDDVIPSPTDDADGEQRAWGRRLAKRFGVDSKYEAKKFTAKNVTPGHLDVEAVKPEDLDADLVELFEPLQQGEVIIAYGWTMAEDLQKLGKR